MKGFKITEQEKKHILEMYKSNSRLIQEQDSYEDDDSQEISEPVSNLNDVVPLEKRVEFLNMLNTKIPQLSSQIQPLLKNKKEDTSLFGDIKKIGDKISDMGISVFTDKNKKGFGADVFKFVDKNGKSLVLNLSGGLEKNQKPWFGFKFTGNF